MTDEQAIIELRDLISDDRTDKENEALLLAIKKLRAERPQGEWIINAEYYSNADIECSVCHNWIIGFNKGLETNFYRYCPFCGEHMRGSKE